jgi:hypothetical protein
VSETGSSVRTVNHLNYSTSTYDKKLNKNKYSHKLHGDVINYFGCASCLTCIPAGCASQQHIAELLTLESNLSSGPTVQGSNPLFPYDKGNVNNIKRG